jgi:hypothetical protein
VSCWAVTICDGALFYPSLCAFLPRFETLVVSGPLPAAVRALTPSQMLAVQRHQEARLAAHYARFLADGAPVLEFEVTAADVPALQQFLTLFGLARRLQAPRTADESAETELDA